MEMFLPPRTHVFKVAAFGGVFNPSDSEYSCRVHLWKNMDKVEQEVMGLERQIMKSDILDVPRYITVDYFDSRAVTIEITRTKGVCESHPELIQSIPVDNVQDCPETSVTFQLTPDGPRDFIKRLSFDIAIYQDPKNKVKLCAKPPIPPTSGNRGK